MDNLNEREGHTPRWRYDCEMCKFNWCCGLGCSCVLSRSLPETPKERQIQQYWAIMRFRIKRGLRPHVDWEECK